ncbi:MAG: twin-arginine translocase subunit TatC [Nitrospirota bacterium]
MNTKKSSEMPVWDHLKELRGSFVRSGLAFAVSSIVAFFFSGQLLSWLTIPLMPGGGHGDAPSMTTNPFVFLSPAEVFLTDIKIAIFTGLAISIPVILYEIWRFISPGLFQKERRSFYPFLILGSLFFYLGVAFCYFLALPFALQFLVSYGQQRGITPAISLSLYVDFNLKFLFSFGLIFELPVIMALLSKTGILTVPFLVHNRKYAIVASFLIAAILTPTPDIFNQCMMAIPLILLYEVGIIAVRLFGEKSMEKQEIKESLCLTEQCLDHVTMAGFSDVGLVRAMNQDVFGIFPEINLAIVADGMGGRPAGEVASKMALDVILETFVNEKKASSFTADFGSLHCAITSANTSVFEAAEHNMDYQGMGTTVVAALIYLKEVLIGFSGDSRAYRNRSGTLTQLTMDHTVANEYFRAGVITKEEAENHPLKRVISRGVGVESAIMPETLRSDAMRGDLFLLATDGLFNMISNEAIGVILTKHHADLSAAISELIGEAKAAGGKDNITVILVRYE